MCGTASAQISAVQPLYSYYSEDDCFEGQLAWPQEMYDDGYTLIQLKYYNYTTGYKVFEHGDDDRIFTNVQTPPDANFLDIDTNLLEWTVGACGLGLWSYQLRMGSFDAEGYLVWEDWEEYSVILIEEVDLSEVPNPPIMIAIMRQAWQYKALQNRRDF